MATGRIRQTDRALTAGSSGKGGSKGASKTLLVREVWHGTSGKKSNWQMYKCAKKSAGLPHKENPAAFD